MKVTIEEGKYKIIIKGFEEEGIVLNIGKDGKILVKDGGKPNRVSVEFRSLLDQKKRVVNLKETGGN